MVQEWGQYLKEQVFIIKIDSFIVEFEVIVLSFPS